MFLKFSGLAVSSVGGALQTYLADGGIDPADLPNTTPVSYPFTSLKTISKMRVNVLTNFTGTFTATLLRNGVPVPGAVFAFGGIGPTLSPVITFAPIVFGAPGQELLDVAVACSANVIRVASSVIVE